jgi:hypothetical protein
LYDFCNQYFLSGVIRLKNNYSIIKKVLDEEFFVSHFDDGIENDNRVSLYFILHGLVEESSKCFKFHYLVSQVISLDTFIFAHKIFCVDLWRFDCFVPNRGFTLENPNWPKFYVIVA